MKQINKPPFEHLRHQDKSYVFDWLKSYWFEQVEPNNKSLSEAVKVEGYLDIEYPKGKNYLFDNLPKNNYSDSTHKALLINIEPIKQDTLESLLKEFLEQSNRPVGWESNSDFSDWRNRAKKVLEQT